MKKRCTVEGCNNDHRARGWCHMHYMRWYHGSSIGQASKLTRQKSAPPCTVDGCDRPNYGHGLCSMHYMRVRLHGEVGQAEPLIDYYSESHINKRGYVVFNKCHPKLPHPNQWANGRIFEHTVIMSELLDRPLRKGERVHHKNGIKDDNRSENLELWYVAHPKGQRVEDLLEFAHHILDLYG